MTEKLLIGIISAIASGVLTYAFKATALEGRLDSVERSQTEIRATLVRIEAKLK